MKKIYTDKTRGYDVAFEFDKVAGMWYAVRDGQRSNMLGKTREAAFARYMRREGVSWFSECRAEDSA